ncbi:phosphotransferase enzyme family protein [Phytoactinopolyspora mesophila]|uniref:Phosphotransferase n=1 Tax=Phytoactinopolyspora mesophila TaxID=2650750 RepID=A0A7K3M7M5_9ACTN|nr:phosphotransferase [Phytoactinopolyspora mesophila]NDL58942.1 phosphotransferase [Phytoactinopolyspora mesophila]
MASETAADHRNVFDYFQARDVPTTSVYPYAPVFPCRVDEYDAVIKRTRRSSDAAQAIAGWTRQAVERGVSVVAPLELNKTNPALIQDEHWVAYPFIVGTVYTASPDQISAAGELLGQLHSATTELTPPPFSWPDPDAESVAEDQEALRKIVAPHAPAAARRLGDLVNRFPQEILPVIREAGLPESAIITDYKANNLIYGADGPVLIDPDNADFGPRLFDLAFAALQFHTEHPPGPGWLFTTEEWSAFVAGYSTHVSLTDAERDLWPLVVEYVLSEESVWTLIESDDWEDPHERAFLLDLAAAEPARFPLPARDVP